MVISALYYFHILNPETRTLIRVVIDDKATLERRVTTLMGNKVEPRRKWIENNVQFSLEDDKSILEESDGTASDQMKKHKQEEQAALEQTNSTNDDAAQVTLNFESEEI